MKDFLNRWWWRTKIIIPWPTETVTIQDDPYAFSPPATFTYSVSPDSDVWAWMTENVGRQGIDWDWDLRDREGNCYLVPTMGWVVLKFRPGKGHHAAMAGCKFG